MRSFFMITIITLAILLFVPTNGSDSNNEDISREITLVDVENDSQGLDNASNSSGRKVRQFGIPGFGGGGFGRPGFGGAGFGGPGFGGRGFGRPGFGGLGFGGPGFGRGGVVRERVRVSERVRVRQGYNNGFGGGFFG